MAVHAHPDDEAISTGGTLARYSAEGARTVLVTCTDGRCGDGPGGVKPGDAGHDPAQVVAQRALELEQSCRILGVGHLERLGYADSGMMGWPQNDEPGSFWTTPLDEAAGKLAALVERYRPQVVVTYDANGFYGHPDHIQAHRVTLAAVAASGIPDKVYFPTVARSRWPVFRQRLREAGLEAPGDGSDDPPVFGSADEEIAARVDVAAWTDHKYDALSAHASQSDNLFFLQMGRQLFGELMGEEAYVRHQDRTGAGLPETDLFAGVTLR
jgi:LmbE family N-acetylglucosaminyl deacetylase